MNNQDFWHSIHSIIDEGFTANGLSKLESYAEQFITQRLIYKRFSSAEQYGCSMGGSTHVIASLLAGANAAADRGISQELTFKEESELGKTQESLIESWARKVNCWYDNADETLTLELGEQLAEGGEAHVYQHGYNLIKAIGLDYYIQPILALDRISLHNTFFPETRLAVVGFGRFRDETFHIIVEQPYIQGSQMTDEELPTKELEKCIIAKPIACIDLCIPNTYGCKRCGYRWLCPVDFFDTDFVIWYMGASTVCGYFVLQG